MSVEIRESVLGKSLLVTSLLSCWVSFIVSFYKRIYAVSDIFDHRILPIIIANTRIPNRNRAKAATSYHVPSIKAYPKNAIPKTNPNKFQ